MQTQAYSEDTTTDFTNPERGWYIRRTGAPGSSTGDAAFPDVLNQYTAKGLVHREWTLPKANAALSPSVLSAIDAELTAFRAVGRKVIHRFAYDYTAAPANMPYNPNESWVLYHIDQIAEVLSGNMDNYCTLECGMIGPWGEWGIYGDGTDVSTSSWKKVMDHWADGIPETHTIQVRYPDVAREYNGLADESKRFQGGKAERIGTHNDCIMATAADGGTLHDHGWGWTAGQLKTFLAANNKILPYGGETCNANGVENGYNNSNLAQAYMETYSMDWLHARYWIELYEQWDSDGVLKTLSRRLGYRLVLKQVQLPEHYVSGGPGLARFQIENVGYGKVFNPRPIDLILKPSVGPARIVRLAADARRDLPLAGEIKWLEYDFEFPGGLSGEYDCWLALRDPAVALQEIPAYSIRLANTGGLWDSGTGWNKLNMTLEAKP